MIGGRGSVRESAAPSRALSQGIEALLELVHIVFRNLDAEHGAPNALLLRARGRVREPASSESGGGGATKGAP